MTGRRWERYKQLLDDFKERGSYWKLRKEAFDSSPRRNRFERGENGVRLRNEPKFPLLQMCIHASFFILLSGTVYAHKSSYWSTVDRNKLRRYVTVGMFSIW
jgi:hypothetical protein